MALRTIRVQGDSVLTKKSRTVDKMTPRIGELITDMLDTMYEVGKKLPSELRETALGGCAATPTGCRFAKKMMENMQKA